MNSDMLDVAAGDENVSVVNVNVMVMVMVMMLGCRVMLWSR